MGKLDCRSTGIGSEIGELDWRRHHSRKATTAINEKFGKLRQTARIPQLMGLLAAAFLLTIGTRGGLANPSAEDIARSWSTNSCLWQDKFAIVSAYFNEKTGYKKNKGVSIRCDNIDLVKLSPYSKFFVGRVRDKGTCNERQCLLFILDGSKDRISLLVVARPEFPKIYESFLQAPVAKNFFDHTYIGPAVIIEFETKSGALIAKIVFDELLIE